MQNPPLSRGDLVSLSVPPKGMPMAKGIPAVQLGGTTNVVENKLCCEEVVLASLGGTSEH